MFHRRDLKNKANSMHEKALRISYSDRTSTFEALLGKGTLLFYTLEKPGRTGNRNA